MIHHSVYLKGLLEWRFDLVIMFFFNSMTTLPRNELDSVQRTLCSVAIRAAYPDSHILPRLRISWLTMAPTLRQGVRLLQSTYQFPVNRSILCWALHYQQFGPCSVDIIGLVIRSLLLSLFSLEGSANFQVDFKRNGLKTDALCNYGVDSQVSTVNQTVYEPSNFY